MTVAGLCARIVNWVVSLRAQCYADAGTRVGPAEPISAADQVPGQRGYADVVAEHCELELTVGWPRAGLYSVRGRFTDPSRGFDDLMPPVEIEIDNDLLRRFESDMQCYGELLSDMVFDAPVFRNKFGEWQRQSQGSERRLRLRLFIEPDAPELHALHWETLRDPQDGTLLATKGDLWFSRYLSSEDWRPVSQTRQRDLRALIVIANPSDIGDHAPGGRELAPLNVSEELDRARQALEDIAFESIPSSSEHSGARSTVDRISERLRAGVDILYLVCHGSLAERDGKDEALLWLEDETGRAARVRGADLVVRLKEIEHRPRLVVLASCQSAGSGRTDDGGVLAALGPRLAAAGIPCVLAMQGNLSLASLRSFMPAFFRELQADGQVDRAMAVARGCIREQPDWWVPVLFTRLARGCLWYAGGFSEPGGGYEHWGVLTADIDEGYCIPVLGGGLIEGLLGSQRDIARHWADRYDFPLAPEDRDDLAQVAQYLAYRQGPAYAREQLRDLQRHRILARYRENLPPDLLAMPFGEMPLDRLISAVGEYRRRNEEHEVHKLLARLPCPVFVTANRDNLLDDALRETPVDPAHPQIVKQPRIVLCRGRQPGGDPPLYQVKRGYRPSVEAPVVFHLFGNLRWPESVVLSEDDYFDHLIGITSNQLAKETSIPGPIADRLAASGLLFLGFQVDDWDFRVLFRAMTLLREQGGRLSVGRARLAVQINPAEGRIIEPIGAREYLRRYFSQHENVDIYWGSAKDFLRELADKRSAGGAG